TDHRADYAVSSVAPCGAVVLRAPDPRARARGYILSPLAGLLCCVHRTPVLAHGATFCRPLRGGCVACTGPPCSRTGLHSVAPCGAVVLRAPDPRARARGYILSPLAGLLYCVHRTPVLAHGATFCRPCGAVFACYPKLRSRGAAAECSPGRKT